MIPFDGFQRCDAPDGLKGGGADPFGSDGFSIEVECRVKVLVAKSQRAKSENGFDLVRIRRGVYGNLKQSSSFVPIAVSHTVHCDRQEVAADGLIVFEWNVGKDQTYFSYPIKLPE